MSDKNSHTFFRTAILVTTLAFLGGCATSGGSAKKDNVNSIDKRAVERWNYLIQHKAEKAYDYLTPGFRATKSREEYAAEMNNRPVRWKTVQFMDKECETDACTVRLYITYTAPINPAIGKDASGFTVIQEKWVRTKDGWLHLPDSQLPAAKPKS